jgi:hypothetical protein
MALEAYNFEEQQDELIHLAPEVFDNLKIRAQRCVDRIEALKSKDIVHGGSSFFDVTGNLLGTVRSNLRVLSSDPIKDCFDTVSSDLPCLERYLDILESNPMLMEAELTSRDGALPELRQQADHLRAENGPEFRPIPWYVSELEKMSTQKGTVH